MSRGTVFITEKILKVASGQVNNFLPAILITIATIVVIVVASGGLIVYDCCLLLRIVYWLHLLIRPHVNSLRSTINNILLIIWLSLITWITLIVLEILIISPLEASSIAKSEAPGRSCLSFWKD